ncbi:hypothetical protein CK203_007104 [Vitis vinifera]|uniref:DUF1995 domain-containing protein n=1 Tax=Vitis vinifera TaxID=29760 RepID=A0A438KCX0_VITVI|nr:hypothetical protein CK203_007104 [Vitis vinifera]
MASSSSSFPSFSCFCKAPLPNSTSPTHFSLSFPASILGGSGAVSLHTTRSHPTTRAKFEKFQDDPPQADDLQFSAAPSQSSSPLESQQQAIQEEVEEDDRSTNANPQGQLHIPKAFDGIHLCFSCLPSDLEGAVRQSGQASASFVSSGGMRAIVELLIPQLQFLDDEGAQAELWELSRIFIDTLIEETGCQRVKAIFPDAGAAALLKYRWGDAAFGFASLSDRKPVEAEDELVVMVVPDYQMLAYVERIASNLSDDPVSTYPQSLSETILKICFFSKASHHVEPRLISEDVGVGFNVRKLRRYFLSTFTVVYSMRPLPAGAVFRCYPGSWKVFYDDKDRPNRYLLAKEQISRPDAEELEVSGCQISMIESQEVDFLMNLLQIIFGDVQDKSEKGPSFFGQAASIFSSLNRFMKVISK